MQLPTLKMFRARKSFPKLILQTSWLEHLLVDAAFVFIPVRRNKFFFEDGSFQRGHAAARSARQDAALSSSGQYGGSVFTKEPNVWAVIGL